MGVVWEDEDCPFNPEGWHSAGGTPGAANRGELGVILSREQIAPRGGGDAL